MSVTSIRPPDDRPGVDPAVRRFRAQAVAIMLALLVMVSGLFMAPPAPAQAASLGVGYGDEQLWIGSFSAHGRAGYCMDIEALPPWGDTQHPELRTTLDDLSAGQLAQLNYVMAKWGGSSDPNVTSAVQLFVWDVADHDTYLAQGGDAQFMTRAPANAHAAILANLQSMRSQAAENAVTNPSASMSIEMSDQFAGRLSVSTQPGSLEGTVTLTNATFTDGSTTATLSAGTHQIIGTPPDGAPEYQIGADFQAESAGLGAGVDLFYTPGEQRILGVASFEPVAASAESPLIKLDFQPEAVSQVDQRLVKPGDQVTDMLTVSVSEGQWLIRDGDPLPVIFEGTAYQVPGTLPPEVGAGVPEDARPVATAQFTATGPGDYQSPEVTLPEAGFVTWVWEVKKSSQPEWVRPYITADWSDSYGIDEETHSVRWPIEITSEMREFNVHKGGRAFDTITMTGFPDNHGDFTGDGFWEADVDEVQHTVYGPFASEKELTDDLDLEGAPVLRELTTPARNGVYELGYTDEDQIVPTKPGYYVMVSTFAGDDRVQPHQTSPADVLERFYVPDDEQPVSVITQATAQAKVGEPFEDLALVQGSEIPENAYLVFRAYGPQDPEADPVCESPFFESDQIPVTQAGVYRSGSTTVNEPGHVYWVETLYNGDDEIVSEGRCGAPGETTVVTGQPEEVTVVTNAVPEVLLGDPAHDVATVTGQPPAGSTLTFEAYRQDGDTATCTDAELVFTSETIGVDGPGDYRSNDVVFDRVGTYYWIETLTGPDGDVLHRGQCGAPNETTKVVSELQSPPELAVTGSDTGWMWPLGIGAGLALAAAGTAIVVGRRLSRQRARDDDTGEEASIDELMK